MKKISKRVQRLLSCIATEHRAVSLGFIVSQTPQRCNALQKIASEFGIDVWNGLSSTLQRVHNKFGMIDLQKEYGVVYGRKRAINYWSLSELGESYGQTTARYMVVNAVNYRVNLREILGENIRGENSSAINRTTLLHLLSSGKKFRVTDVENEAQELIGNGNMDIHNVIYPLMHHGFVHYDGFNEFIYRLVDGEPSVGPLQQIIIDQLRSGPKKIKEIKDLTKVPSFNLNQAIARLRQRDIIDEAFERDSIDRSDVTITTGGTLFYKVFLEPIINDIVVEPELDFKQLAHYAQRGFNQGLKRDVVEILSY